MSTENPLSMKIHYQLMTILTQKMSRFPSTIYEFLSSNHLVYDIYGSTFGEFYEDMKELQEVTNLSPSLILQAHTYFVYFSRMKCCKPNMAELVNH